MDPDANLEEQRRLAAVIKRIWDTCRADGTLTRQQMEVVSARAEELAEYILALDEWISQGGCLPSAWRRDNAL